MTIGVFDDLEPTVTSLNRDWRDAMFVKRVLQSGASRGPVGSGMRFDMDIVQRVNCRTARSFYGQIGFGAPPHTDE